MREYQKTDKKYNFKHNSIYSLFFDKYQAQPDNEFIISIHNGVEETYTYSQFLQRVIKVQDFLVSRGLKKGDAINLIIQNSADFLVIYFAALSKGIIVCPINYNLTPIEIAYIINDSKSYCLFVDEEYIDKVSAVSDDVPLIKEVFIFSKDINKDFGFFNIYSVYSDNDIINEVVFSDEVDVNDKAVIIYTSGTSGKPKGAILTHANLLSDAQAIADWFKFDRNTRTLCILPLFHNNGQVVTFLAPLSAGGSTVMIKGNVSLIAFWDLVARFNVTWSSVIPTILSVLLSFKRKRKDTTMKGIICGGALLPKTVQEEFEKEYKVPIYEGYGLTETTSFSCFNPLDIAKRKIGSIGKELPLNNMCIMGQEGEDLGIGEIGEICIKGSNVFLEYCNLPERDRLVFRGGWFHSGDFGYKDEEGFFYIQGRQDDLIIKGGENLYPQEIENVVYGHSGVKSCAAVGVDHPTWGEDVILFIEEEDGREISEEEIKKRCQDHLAVFKIPSKVYFIKNLNGMDEIPKGPTKKILRKELKKYYEMHLR